MREVHLTTDEYKKLLDKAQFIFPGSEGFICSLGDKILKKFNSRVSPDKLKNKSQKLRLVHELGPSEHWVYPEELLFTPQFSSYTMEKFAGYNIDFEYFDTIEERIKILLRLRKGLLVMHALKIIFVDIYPSNIMIKYIDEQFECKYVDIDNICIDKLKHEISNDFIEDYLKNKGVISINSDIFMFNQFSFWFLNGGCSNQRDVLDPFRKASNRDGLNHYGKGCMFSLASKEENIYQIVKELSDYKVDSSCDNEFLLDRVTDIVKCK